VKLKYNVYQKDTEPQLVVDLTDVQKVSLSHSHSIAMTTLGEVFTAGSTDNGQLGIGVTYDTSVPLAKLPMFSDELRAVDVGCGDHFCMVLERSGVVYAFGKGSFGRLGLGGEEDVLVPQRVQTSHRIVQLACGGRHVACLNSEGEVVVWGYGFYGQLCTEGDDDLPKPTAIDLAGQTGYWAKRVVCGYFSTALVTL
jgi:alpha-tubulin suppressor-like RCC1 family protein